MKLFLVLATIPVVLLMASCSLNDEDSSSGSAAVPTPTVPTQVARPLDAYLPTDTERKTLDKAVTLIANDCLKRFELGPVTYTVRAVMDMPELNQRKFGFVDEDIAAQWGYRSRPIGPPPQDTGPEVRTPPSPGVSHVLRGMGESYRGQPVPAEGCYGEAMRKLTRGASTSVLQGRTGGDTEMTLLNIVWKAEADSSALADKDDRYLAMERRWSTCMKDSGYNYSSRESAVENPRWDTATKKPSQQETRVAVADSRCQKKVNYLGVLAALLKETDQEIIEKQSEALSAVKKIWQTRLRNAADVVQGGAGS